MYTGRTEQPCCLCGATETATRIDIPPRAVSLMRHGDPIAWRDIVGTVSIHFCASDWETVADLVEMDLLPLSRCNAARASLSLREDYEALLNETRGEPDQTALERDLVADARETIANEADPMVERRDVVAARVTLQALAELHVLESAEPGD